MSAHYYPRYRLRRPCFRFPYRNSDRRSLDQFAHLGRNANLNGENQLLLSELSERPPAFNGLLVAALIATLFWVTLIVGILRLK